MNLSEIEARSIDNNGVDLDQLNLLEPVQEKYKLNRHFSLLAIVYLAVSMVAFITILAWLDIELSFIPFAIIGTLLIMLPTFLFGCWANHTHLYRYSERVLALFTPLCDEGERLISFSVGKLGISSQLATKRSYFLFSTKRIFVVHFNCSIQHKAYIEDAVVDGSIINKIEDIYMCGYGQNDSKYGGLVRHAREILNYTKLTVPSHNTGQRIEYLLEHKYSKNGRLIRRIFDAAKNKSSDVRKMF